jgi:glycosyltransferase involved in cell wall biosynthesis
MNSQQQLVSIIIVTYNSAKFVLKTLESALNQSYQNLELIISDDCSTDETVNLCNQWLEKNKLRFTRSELITTTLNSGISPNCNRGVQKATADWIKIIAGDDELLPNCIADNVTFIENNKEARFIFSKMIKFNEKNGKKEFYENFPVESHKILFNTHAKIQYQNLITDNLVCPAPASFIHRQSLIQLGTFNEQYPFIEDYPLWVKCTLHNYPLYYFDKATVLYRKGESLTQTGSYWRHSLFYQSVVHHFKSDVAKDLKAQNKMFYFAKRVYFFKLKILMSIFRNKMNFFSKSFNYLFDFLFLNILTRISKKKILPKSHFNIVQNS